MTIFIDVSSMNIYGQDDRNLDIFYLHLQCVNVLYDVRGFCQNVFLFFKRSLSFKKLYRFDIKIVAAHYLQGEKTIS